MRRTSASLDGASARPTQTARISGRHSAYFEEPAGEGDGHGVQKLGSRSTTGGATTAYGYDAAGNLTATTLPAANGFVETRSYDRAGRLTDISTANGQTTLAHFAYALDPGWETRLR